MPLDYENFNTKLFFIVGSFMAWSILFFAINWTLTFPKLTKRENDDIKNRIVSALHGLYAFIAIGYHFWKEQPEYGTTNTPLQHIIILTSAGYVIYDSIACFYYGLYDKGLIIHHSMVIFGYWACQYYGYSTEGLTGLFYAEASNAPMHMRMILKTLKMRYTALYESLETLYLVIYIVFRGIFATFLFFDTWSMAVTPLAVKFTCSGIWLQSMIYIFEMFGIVKRKVKQFMERRQKNISYWWLEENPKLSNLSYYRREIRDKIF